MFVTIARSRATEEKKRIIKNENQVREIKNTAPKPEKTILKTQILMLRIYGKSSRLVGF